MNQVELFDNLVTRTPHRDYILSWNCRTIQAMNFRPVAAWYGEKQDRVPKAREEDRTREGFSLLVKELGGSPPITF